MFESLSEGARVLIWLVFCGAVALATAGVYEATRRTKDPEDHLKNHFTE